MTQEYIDALAKAIKQDTSSDTICGAALGLLEALKSQAVDQAREALRRQGYIAVLWSIEDVTAVRPDLTDGQAMEVLERCLDKMDAEIGINWLVIETIAEDMFPEPEEGE
jgi:hypothetical protein